MHGPAPAEQTHPTSIFAATRINPLCFIQHKEALRVTIIRQRSDLECSTKAKNNKKKENLKKPVGLAHTHTDKKKKLFEENHFKLAIYRRSIPPGGFHGYLRALAARCWGGSVPAPCATARVPAVPPVTNLRAAPAPLAAVLGKTHQPQPQCGVPTPMPGPRGLVPAWGDAVGHPKGSRGSGKQGALAEPPALWHGCSGMRCPARGQGYPNRHPCPSREGPLPHRFPATGGESSVPVPEPPFAGGCETPQR